MRFSRKENILINLFCLLELLTQGIVAAAGTCKNTTDVVPAGVQAQLFFPRYKHREDSAFFRGHRIKRNNKMFAFLEKGSSVVKCTNEPDVVLKEFCLLKTKVSKNNDQLVLQISDPAVIDSGCYSVEWVYNSVESEPPEEIYLSVIEGSHTTQHSTSVTLNKDNINYKSSSSTPAPAAVSAASFFRVIKPTLFLCCVLLSLLKVLL